MKAWDAFLPRVMPDVPGCPSFTVEEAIRQAAIDFFHESGAWLAAGTAVLASTAAGQAGYAVTVPDNTGIARLRAVWVGSEEVEVLLPGEELDIAPGERAEQWRVGLTSPTTIQLSPAPLQGGQQITAAVAYEPTEAAEGIDDVLFARWRTAIEAKAKTLLLAQPGEEWTQPLALSLHEGIYQREVMLASNSVGPVRRRPLRVKGW